MFEQRRWGEIARLSYGKALRGYKDTSDGRVPVFGTNGPTGFTRLPLVEGPGVIIGRKGAYRGVHYSASPFWVIDTAYFLEPAAGVDLLWAYYSLLQSDINGLDSGSAIPSTTRESFYSLPVLVPPLSEQRAIAEVLGALDDKIAANTKLAAAIDDYLATLFASLLLSGGYEVSCLCDIARVNGGSVKPQPGGTLRYIDIAGVGVGSHAFPDEMTWADAPGRARRRLSKGDVIWSTVRPNRRSHSLNLSDDPLLVASTGLAVLTPVGVGFAYLYEATRLPGFTTYLENVADGSAYPAVRADRFNDAPVPLMPTESRCAFESIGEPMREQSHALSQENRTLAATRDALLPQLMSGKLRVKDAEKVAAEVV